jgi:hypothetical protein
MVPGSAINNSLSRRAHGRQKRSRHGNILREKLDSRSRQSIVCAHALLAEGLFREAPSGDERRSGTGDPAEYFCEDYS